MDRADYIVRDLDRERKGPAAKLARMVQPDSLKTDEYQPWSRGRGTDVWAMLCASVAGDLAAVTALVAKDPGLADCEFEYFRPVRFAVRENHRPLVEFLLAHGADAAYEAGDSLPGIARERGYTDLAAFLEAKLNERYNVSPEAEEIAAAMEARDAARVRELLAENPELVHLADGRGNQPIHWAVMTRQISLIDHLLELGADINAVRPDGLRPLHLTNGDYHYRGWRDLPATALQRHEVLVGYLLARGAEYDLVTASKLGDLDRVRELLDGHPELVNRVPACSYYTGVPLRNAAGAGHVAVVKLLLERGADPNQPEPGIAPHGGALHSAIGGRHYDIVRLLLAHGANPNAEVESSGNCLFMAKHVGAPKEIVDLIASYGGVMGAGLADIETLAAMLHANPNLRVGERFDSPEMITLLLRYQPDLLSRSPDPTPWWSMATPPTPDLARWLMERGLDPNRRNWLGITLLHRCAGKGDTGVASVCLEYGADINAVETEWSSTPLGWAAREGKKEMVEWLLARGADPHLPEDESWALPSQWAARRGHRDIADLLR
jgi:ankyrin repeat protein